MGARTFTNWHAPKQYKISHIMSQEQYYLYPGGWQTQHLLGTTVGTNMHDSISSSAEPMACKICSKRWPTRTHLNTDPYTCNRCQCDKHNNKLYSAGNDMGTGSVPPHLQEMTQIEELLIARACP